MERIRWYEKMVEAYKTLSDEQRAELEHWEASKENNQDIADWPGWEKIIGSRPNKTNIEAFGKQ
jgi:hypothetical protein